MASATDEKCPAPKTEAPHQHHHHRHHHGPKTQDQPEQKPKTEGQITEQPVDVDAKSVAEPAQPKGEEGARKRKREESGREKESDGEHREPPRKKVCFQEKAEVIPKPVERKEEESEKKEKKHRKKHKKQKDGKKKHKKHSSHKHKHKKRESDCDSSNEDSDYAPRNESGESGESDGPESESEEEPTFATAEEELKYDQRVLSKDVIRNASGPKHPLSGLEDVITSTAKLPPRQQKRKVFVALASFVDHGRR